MLSFPTKIKARLPNKALYGIVLLVIFGIALALRVSLFFKNIFTGDAVIFGGVDTWYHMRLVENLVQHFPHRIAFDPFTLFPSGQTVPFAPFFDLLLGFFIWVVGLGSPTQYTIETVGAYFPAILGALVTIPVYFIGRELFNRNAGLIAAGLIAILPGQYFFRSLLGFTDHHIAEVLFSTTAALFLILAIKRAGERETSFSHIRSKDWGNLKKPLIYALLAGLAVGIYLITWIGGVFFVFIIFAYVVIQYIIDHLRGKPTDSLCIIGVPMFLIALIIVIPFLDSLFYSELVIAALIIGILTPVVLSGVSRLMTYRGIKRLYYPLALTVLGIVGIALLYVIDPSLCHNMVGRFQQVFTPSGAAQTIGEVRPLLSLEGLLRMGQYFTTALFIFPIALGLLIYAEIKEKSFERTITFLIIWSLVMLLAMLGQNRFAYYFAVNVALLTGYFCWRLLEWSWRSFRGALPESEKGKGEVAQGKRKGLRRPIQSYFNTGYARVAVWTMVNFIVWGNRMGAKTNRADWKESRMRKEAKVPQVKGPPGLVKSYLNAGYVQMAGMALLVLFLAFVPNIVMAIEKGDIAGPSEAWYSSLVWMRENTPDPFEDPDFYYELYDRPPAGESYDYPESAYGVMNWWDYGHWITRIAHRIPSADPFQAGVQKTAQFFIAQNESLADEIVAALGSKYVIIDYAMATNIFDVMPVWAGQSDLELAEWYIVITADEKRELKLFYYPEYYQSMNSRLYNFYGEAVVPHNSTLVISYEEKSTAMGSQYKEISGIQRFATYEEAQEYIEAQAAPNYRIVGEDPFNSPVPLEKLRHYQLVHQSDPEILIRKKVGPIPEVKIFEYLP